LRALGALRPFDSLGTISPLHLNRTGIVASLPAMVIGNVISPIKPSKFSTAIGPTIFPSIYLPILTSIFSSIQLAILSSIFSAVQ